MTRKPKNASRTQHRSRNLPGSIVHQALAAINPRSSSATTIRPLPAGPKSTSHQPNQIEQQGQTATALAKPEERSGAQGRVRTSVGHNPADLQSAAINHSATCAFGFSTATPSRFARNRRPAHTPCLSRDPFGLSFATAFVTAIARRGEMPVSNAGPEKAARRLHYCSPPGPFRDTRPAKR